MPNPSRPIRAGIAVTRVLLALTHLVVILAIPLLAALVLAAVAQPGRAEVAPIYWGAYIDGSTYGLHDAPFEPRTIDAFEENAGKRVSIVHWGQSWYRAGQGGYQSFPRDMAERVRRRGSIPMMTWSSWDLDSGQSLDHPDFRLQGIIDGSHDAFIRKWARDARAWGHPLFLRFDHEMNGNWFPWSEDENGNSRGQFARMWMHVHDIFTEEGATNVTWVWAPNIVYDDAIPLSTLYPGDEYVDWVGASGYNWGTHPARPDSGWKSFSEAHRETYDQLGELAPDKPIMITETASSEVGGSKPSWIADALGHELPAGFPRIKALIWFNWNTEESGETMDWVIESSDESEAAFAEGIASPHYAANSFGALPKLSKIAPIGSPAKARCTAVSQPARQTKPDKVTHSRRQLLINQRISQAAVRRANAAEAWLDAKVAARDIGGGGLAASSFAAEVTLARTADTAEKPIADPRPVKVRKKARKPGRVAVSRCQLVLNQRISQAALRRSNALLRRLRGGLTGGDLREGAITAEHLESGLVVTAVTAAGPVPSPSRTILAPKARRPGRLRMDARQLKINQRISQAAVRRANTVIAILRRGLTSAEFTPGTIVAANLSPELRGAQAE